MKPKFLFICPTKYYYKEIRPEDVKYHVLTLMSHIDDLADIELVDFEILFGYPRSEADINSFLENARRILGKYSPDLVGISCYTSFDYICTVDLLRICSDIFPKAVLIVGGYHPTAEPEDFINEDIPIHFIIRGEGENALRDIIIQNGKNLPVIIQGKPLDLCRERPMRYDLYPYKTKVMSITLSRGCVHRCSFCVQSDNFESPYRRINIESVKDKMERAAAHFKIKRFLINDPFFGVHTDTTIELLEYFKERFPDTSFWAETRIDRLDRTWFKHFSSMEVDLHFGVESLADDTLQLMQKTKNSQQYNESFFKAIEMCQEFGVVGKFGFIMNFPGELLESYLHTITQMKKAVDLYEKANFTLHSNPYSLFPGNKIYEKRFELAKTRGFSFPNDGWWRVKDPDIMARREHCFASSSIVEKYGERKDFWAYDMAQINKELVYKYTYRAFVACQEIETKRVVSHYYKDRLKLLDKDSIDEREKLVARLRFFLKDSLKRYEKYISVFGLEHYLEIFRKTYDYSTHRFLYGFLKEYEQGTEAGNLYTRLETIERDLDEEYKENTASMGKNEAEYLVFRLFDVIYKINADGSVHYRIKQEATNS